MSKTSEPIRIDRHDHVAEVVLDRADRLNTMAPAFFRSLRRAFEEIDDDAQVRAAIVWAEGRMFTAGLDLKEAFAGLGGAGGTDGPSSQATRNFDLYRLIRDWQDSISAAERCRKPVIAAVHGHCIGGGVDLVTACDIRLCSQDATFSIRETKMAMVADIGTLQRITGVVGKGIAREMAYTGKRIDARRALACGLVNDVLHDKDALLQAARDMADEIAANSPLAVQGTKTVLGYSEQRGIEAGLEYVAQWNSSFVQSNDLAEALQAFLEKREPDFRGT
jgi:enoyl-CoA hydratase